MKRLSIHRGRPAWVSAEADLAQSIEALDQDTSGWDDEVRLLGLVRRLERDATARGIQAAVDVYGETSLQAVLPCAGLRVSDGQVVGDGGDVRYQFRNGLLIAAEMASVEAAAPAESPLAAEVMRALMSGMTMTEVARMLSLSTATVRRLYDEGRQARQAATTTLKGEEAA